MMRSSSHFTSFVTAAWSQVTRGPFPDFPVTFPLPGFAASQASAASSFDQLVNPIRLSLFSPWRLCVIQ